MSARPALRRALALTVGLVTAGGIALGIVPPTPAWADPGAPTGRVIVKFTGSAAVDPTLRGGALRTAAARAGTQLRESRTLATGASVVEVRGETATAAASRLSARADVEYAVADLVIPRSSSVTRPAASIDSSQWNLATSRAGLDVAQAWRLTRGSGVRVAVLDTGITAHPDLAGRVVGGYDFVSSDASGNDDRPGRDADPSDPGDGTEPGDCGDPNGYYSSWHGTHVAGIIAAADDGRGTVGVAPSASVVPVRVMGKCGGTTLDLYDAMIWAAGGPVAGVPQNRHPAKVLNLSLGAYGRPCDSATQAVINRVRHLGALPVVAAGNDGDDVELAWPANCDGVVSVAASDRDGRLGAFSNRGDRIDVTAPGVDIRSTYNSGGQDPGAPTYEEQYGTSMAAPHVSGIVALMLALQPTLLPPALEGSVKRGVESMPECSSCGAGLADARRSVDQVIHPTVSAGWLARGGSRGVLGAFRSQRSVGGGFVATFAQGYLTAHPTHGAHATWGRIGAEWNRLGGVTGPGFIVADETRGRSGHVIGRFSKGSILYSAQGAHYLSGSRLTTWTRLSAAESDTLGQLRTGTVTDRTAATYTSHFTNGAIVNSSAGTFWMHSAVYRRHQALPAATRTALKGLTAAETAGLIPGQRVSRFSGGAIYYAGDTGAWAVTNEIDRRYRATGVAAALGNPKGLARSVRFGARKAGFARGTIYAHSSSGVWEVHGAIGRAFDAAGAENSRLELPTSGEIRSGSTVYQKFRGGRITYAGGRATIRYT